MARRRDVRRLGRGPYLRGLRRVEAQRGRGFPFDVPAVAAVEELQLDRLTRAFLDAPDRVVHAALDDLDAD